MPLVPVVADYWPLTIPLGVIGSTPDFGSGSLGSNPSGGAREGSNNVYQDGKARLGQ